MTGLDFQESRHRSRSGNAKVSYRDNSWVKDASFANTGVFGELTWHAADDSRVIGGARVDWASAKDFRRSSGSKMMPMPNPTAGERRTDTLPLSLIHI